MLHLEAGSEPHRFVMVEDSTRLESGRSLSRKITTTICPKPLQEKQK